MGKPLVLISSRSFSTGNVDLIGILNASGCLVRKISSNHDLNEISEDLKEAVAWIAGVAPITDEMLEKAPKLKVISRYGVGLDSVDLNSAKKRKVIVANTPGANSNSVAELALGLIFASLRNLSLADANVRSGNWSAVRGQEINGLLIGVIGYGKIGKLVSKKLLALGAKVMVFDPFVQDPNIVDLETLNKKAQLVTLHSPGEEKIITKSWIQAAPVGQIIVNTARANLVDEIAIAEGLNSGKLAFYAADSISTENSHETSTLLRDDFKDKTLFTPHLGAQTIEAIDLMGSMAVENVLAVLAGKPVRNQVI